MTDLVDRARDRYRADGLLGRVRAAVNALAPEPEPLTAEQLAQVGRAASAPRTG